MLIFTIVSLLMIISCSRGTINNKKDAKVQFNLNIPKIAMPTPLPKADGEIDAEVVISEIFVLVFDEKYRLSEIVEGDNLSHQSGVTSFNARISSSKKPATLILVANVNFRRYSVSIGSSMEMVIPALKMSYTISGITSLLPMSGVVSLASVEAGTHNVSVEMLRSIARADVIVQADNFVLVDARIYRANSSIQLIPSESNSIDWLNPAVTLPSVPSESGLTINGTIPVAADEQTNSIEAKLYLPEAFGVEPGDASISIIVGGYYNGSNTLSYYRIDFKGGISGHPYGQILRNHKYIFNIKSVYNQGRNTPELAANNEATDVEAQIKEWKDHITYIESD